jgi:glycosyltransferase involved in cell wall biosynthesis
MKICFLGDAIAQHLYRWAIYFATRGHHIDVITFNPLILDHYGDIQVHIIRKKILSPALPARFVSTFSLVRDLKKKIDEINPDIIHSHSAAGYAWMAMFIGFRPFIITPWGNDVLIDVKKSKLGRFLTTRALKKADLITCDGENTREALLNLSIPQEKIRFITFGVDVLKFRMNPKKEEIKAHLCLSHSKIVISTRTLTPVHNVETVVRAIPLVRDQISDVQFVIIGDGPEKEYLMNLAKDLNIYDAVRFPGQATEDEMALFLQSADLYVSTSLSESGIAASTAEAMACELPVVNTNTGDIELWIKDGNGGFIIPVKKPDVLANKIIGLLNDNELRLNFGKINRQTIEERNNYYKEMEKMENIYKELVMQVNDR